MEFLFSVANSIVFGILKFFIFHILAIKNIHRKSSTILRWIVDFASQIGDYL